MKIISFFSHYRLVYLTNQTLSKSSTWVHVDNRQSLIKEFEGPPQQGGTAVILTADPPESSLSELVKDLRSQKGYPKIILVAMEDRTTEESLTELKSHADS